VSIDISGGYGLEFKMGFNYVICIWV